MVICTPTYNPMAPPMLSELSTAPSWQVAFGLVRYWSLKRASPYIGTTYAPRGLQTVAVAVNFIEGRQPRNAVLVS